MTQLVQNLLSYGAGVFLPLIVFLLGLIVRLKPGRALSAGLMLGVAFTGMSTLINFMGGAIGPAGQAMVGRTGLQLTALDFGGSVAYAVAWAWPYVALLFLFQIGINVLMLAMRWTETLNVDMWNVHQKAFMGAVITYITGSPLVAFLFCGIWIVMELKSADLTKNQVYRLTKIPGVSVPHNSFLELILMAPVNRLMDFIPGLKKIKATPESIKEKLGFFGENHILGFIIGILLGISAGYDTKSTLTLGVQAATALVLFPLVAQLFMQALAPIAEASSKWCKERFKNRQIYIGLDWPILAGQPSIWAAAILNIPLVLLFAIILPGNKVLPFADIMLIPITMAAALLTQGDFIRTFLITVIWTPLYFYVGTYFAPILTKLAVASGAFTMPEGAQEVTRLGLNAAPFRWLFAEASKLFNGQLMPGIIIVPVLAVLYWFYVKEMKRKEALALEDKTE